VQNAERLGYRSTTGLSRMNKTFPSLPH